MLFRSATADALALGSAAARTAVEAAVVADDEAALVALRAERLGRAARCVAAAARAAWHPTAPTGPSFRIGPNPLRGPATLRLDLPQAGDGRLELFDAAGRRVRVCAVGRLAAGAQHVSVPASWSAGLAAGVYCARLEVAGHAAECRVTLLGD